MPISNVLLGNCDQAALILEQVVLEEIDDQYMFDIGSFLLCRHLSGFTNPHQSLPGFSGTYQSKDLSLSEQYSSGIEIIDKILDRIAAGGNSRYEVEALIIKSMLLLEMGEKQQAVQVFQNAIALSSKEGYIQAFLNEGIGILPLIEAVRENPTGDIEQRVFILTLWENLQGKLRKQQAKGWRSSCAIDTKGD